MHHIQDSQLSNALRFLAIDMVEKAVSGHPGMPMGMADVFTILFKEFLSFIPQDPTWKHRDRLILSVGHGSALLYAALFLAGYTNITIEELKQFRQLGSKTPGHPEYAPECGIEVTTGPLGQGLANAVGIAISESILNARLGATVAHKTYAIVGDGCLMEGISQEAISLAGHLQLTNIIVIFDDNNISIDGNTYLASSEDHEQRFLANHWLVLKADGHNFTSIREVLTKAVAATKPVLIICKTTIGLGSPNKAGKAIAHGSPLGPEEVALARKTLNWDYPQFYIPHKILSAWRNFWKRNNDKYNNSKQFENKLEKFTSKSTDAAISALKILADEYIQHPKKEATRQSSGNAIAAAYQYFPLLGGSADLSSSSCTLVSGHSPLKPGQFNGNYIHYGVREHAMAAIMNGIAVHGTFRPYGGTFLTFSDYCRPAIRLAAMMKQPVIFIFTHDSIGLGEDGPTHQPIEHLASLRAIPNLLILRPCDAIETIECWQIALKSQSTPIALVLTRQAVEQQRNAYTPPAMKKKVEENLSNLGGYILKYSQYSTHMVTIVATGSEVQIATEVASKLEEYNIGTVVVSMPCRELFRQQGENYRKMVLGNMTVLKVLIEAGVASGWESIIGDGLYFSIESFGRSGPYDEVYSYFGLKADIIIEKIKCRLNIS